MKAIGYIRVSTAEQAVSGLGVEDQRQRVEAYCRLKGLELVRFIDDNACSGGKPLGKRPGGGKLLAALRRKEANAVVILKLDRGFRNAADCLATVERWERKGTTLHIVDLGGNAIDTASASGKFMLTVLAGAAEMERNLTRERTRAALSVKRRRGERISRHAPFGYTLTSDGAIQPEPTEQRAVSRARRLREAGKSLRQIAADLAGRGMFGRNGQTLSAKTIRAILQRDAA
jgi:DNA invertase Pin-like site-specific DNA recombinase